MRKNDEMPSAFLFFGVKEREREKERNRTERGHILLNEPLFIIFYYTE